MYDQKDLDAINPSEEQVAYANILFYGCWLGLVIMTITYLLYVFGIVTPHVPLEQMPNYWGLSVTEYLQTANVPTGWGWTSLLGQGDFLNFIGVVVLAGLSIVCYARVIPIFMRNKEKALVTIAVTEVIVLLVAASGLVGSGGH